MSEPVKKTPETGEPQSAEVKVPEVKPEVGVVSVPPPTTEKDTSEDIPHAYLELYRHTSLRGANLGAVLSLVLAPPYLLYKGVRAPGDLLRRLGVITARGMVIGILFGVGGTYARIRNNEYEQVYDRCYRLRHNLPQVRTDRFTYGGLLLGALGGVATRLAANPVMSGFQGASIGAGLAVFAHVLTKKKEEKKEKEKKD